MEGSAHFILLIFAIFSPLLCLGEQAVPLIAWSNTRSLANTPRIPAGRQITSEILWADYMDSILHTQPQNIFLFLFDELSMNDITKYSDAMSADGTGGALKHLKKAMEESASDLVLPNVISTHLEGDIRSKVDGATLTLGEPDLAGSTLDLTKTNLIVVHLTVGIGSQSKRDAFTQADKKIASFIEELQPGSVSYTAILTSKPVEEVSRKPSDDGKLTIGRRLLETSDSDEWFVANYKSTGVVKCNAYVTATTLEIATSIPKAGSKAQYEVLPTTYASWETDGICRLGTDLLPATVIMNMTLTTGFPASLKSFVMSMRFDRDKHQFWTLATQSSVTFTETNGDPVQYTLQKVLDDTPVSFSYHCSDTVFRLTPVGSKTATALLHFTELQIQPFSVKAVGKVDNFGQANDCVGFFTEGIWMGLVLGFVFLIIFFIGFGMLANLTVMDKFDDPKGKTITVNVAGE